jgi:hypothetical protein
MSSLPIDQPGTIYSPCGKWGCGSHGECGGNNTCTCFHGWSGDHCESPPISPPNANVGDLECGNWGVFGTLTLNTPGYAPTCDCWGTGMTGSRCHVECESNDDCGSGVCDTEVGRCQCTDNCFNDDQCEWGSCVAGKCTNGWTDVGCRRALSSECNQDSDCGHGSCVNNVCQCDQGYIGGRCEKQLAGTGEACTYSSDCRDAVVNDVCVDNVCQQFGNECNTHEDCRVICREGICTFPLIPPEISEQDFGDMFGALVEELLTPEGMAQMYAEEKIEDALALVPSALALGYAKLKRVDKLITRAVKKVLAKRSASVSFQGAAPAVTRGMITSAVKNLSNQATRQGIKSAAAKMGGVLSSWKTGALFFALQAVGMILDIDDAAGFSAQVSQDNVDMYMRKMLKSINEFEDLRDAGVQFPREYLPQSTITYRAKLYGEVAEDRKTDLVLDYIDHLDVNSNGGTIIRDWTPSSISPQAEEPDPKQSTLWALSGENEQAYTTLSKWWWLILISFIVVVLALGLGIGLSAKKRRNNNI